MRCAEVIINLPIKSGIPVFTYHVPVNMENDIRFGQRVLVELGKKKHEGIIVNEDAPVPLKPTRPLVKILSPEPLLDYKLYILAQWISEYYACSLSTALALVLPRKPKPAGRKIVLPLLSLDEIEGIEENQQNLMEFMNELWERGELSYREAVSRAGQNDLNLWQEMGLIHISGQEPAARIPAEEFDFVLKDFDPEIDLPGLIRKAPRQAEAVQLLLRAGSIEKKTMEKMIPVQSLRSLIDKGFIEMVPRDRANLLHGHILSPDQAEVLARLDQAVQMGGFAEFLLYGVTGSGKTEIYIRLAEKVLNSGRDVLVLIPEIALTRHLLEIFSTRIKNLEVLHSRMADGERYRSWKRINDGEARLVLGARSAVFAPLHNIGLIIMDEEQENTFKQQEQPRYHTRDVARQRAKMEEAIFLLGSATPAVESFYRACAGDIRLLRLPERVGSASMPTVHIADMKTSRSNTGSIISPLLREKLSAILERNEQAIIFQNRRGFAPLTICLECGHIPSCPHCTIALSYHRDQEMYICHYCNHQARVPVSCSACGSKHLQQVGTGTQKIEFELQGLFPQARIERLDLDRSRQKGSQAGILSMMKKKQIDILVGTQMVARGLDFPNVSLVGIVDMDNMLNLPDFRAAERCFQLMVQAAGRAGRGDKAGEVIIQSYQPDDKLIRLAAEQDYEKFYLQEIEMRRILNYPPFTHLLRIVISAVQEEFARQVADMISLEINEMVDAREELFTLLGPAPCPLYR
ncbi:replication restart helicase PriA [Syntrophomonas palmitatica]|uniref:replication restart helicase PriA n=1 Tax=Syntrophomonas palmitatica TaxID=402877 RepID=UPI0006D24FDF|nr:primosomal protein N' [Syntrophomonas palmitatica]